MTKVEAIIGPGMLKAARGALEDLGLRRVTVTHVMNSGEHRGETQYYRGMTVENIPDKIKLEVLVTDERVDEAMSAIAGAASTGKLDEGEILAYKIGNTMRIGTPGRGESISKS